MIQPTICPRGRHPYCEGHNLPSSPEGDACSIFQNKGPPCLCSQNTQRGGRLTQDCLPANSHFPHFSTQLTSAICFLLVPGRCLTSQKIKIETMKANHFNFLLSYLQVYLNLPLFLSPPQPAQRRKHPFSKLPLLRTDSPGHYRSPKTTARSHPADLFPGSQ